MSSEYSSAGEETDIDPDEPTSAHDLAEKESRKAARAQRWREAIAVKVESMPEGDRQNYGAFGFAQGDKVLEVRKPRWRSDEVGLFCDCLMVWVGFPIRGGEGWWIRSLWQGKG